MPSASLHFRLPEDEDAFRAAQNGESYREVLNRLSTWLRNKIKYCDEPMVPAAEVRQMIYTICDECRVEID